jgi:hypothetical protein
MKKTLLRNKVDELALAVSNLEKRIDILVAQSAQLTRALNSLKDIIRNIKAESNGDMALVLRKLHDEDCPQVPVFVCRRSSTGSFTRRVLFPGM